MLPFKVSHNEQYSVIRFPWTKASTYAFIHPELCPVHCDKCFTKSAMHAWCNKFTNSQESVINKERSGRSVVLMAARSFFIDNTFLTMVKLLGSKCALLTL